MLDLNRVAGRGTKPDELALANARVAIARGEFSWAADLLTPLVTEGESELAARAHIQLARVRHEMGERDEAVLLLKGVASLVKTLRAARLEVPYLRKSGEGTLELRSEVLSQLELELECARAWARIGCVALACRTYVTLLGDREVTDPRTADRRRIAAMAEFRLGELRVENAPEEAYARWKRVIELRDEEVSPHAALRMATDLGGKLVAERVERLFNIVIGASDPVVSSAGVLGLARHFESLHQFGEARRHYETVVDYESDQGHVEAASRGLKSLERQEWMIFWRESLTRPRQLCSMVQRVRPRSASSKLVLLVGAGTGGSYLAESLDSRRYEICGFVDDRAYEAPAGLDYRVLGPIERLGQIIDQYRPDEVLLAIPTLAGSRRKAVVTACRATRTPLLNLPRMHDLGIGWTREENRSRLMTQLRPVQIEEMIGDDRVELDLDATNWLQYEVAVVIGAGAMGAEICRRLADGEAGKIVVVDRRPSAIRKIEEELCGVREFKEVEFRLGDATKPEFIADVLRSFGPYVVFNTTGDAAAAALEPKGIKADPGGWKEILRNELKVIAAVSRAAAAEGVPKTVHISSPRAGDVDTPFGAVKALCEELALWYAQANPQSVQVVVRVGTLFDSRHGLFAKMRKQIEAGQTVTIPRSDARARYIPISRWAELVLHSACLASNGDLLEPDGGVEIVLKEIAEEAIRLQGLYPDEVQIDPEGAERWDEPRLPARRTPRNEDLGIFALDRPGADCRSVDAALLRCSSMIARHTPAVEIEPWVRDFIEGLVDWDSEPDLGPQVALPG